MPITRARLQDRRQSVTLDFPGTTDTLTLWYRPDGLSPRSERELLKAATKAAGGDQATLMSERNIGYLLLWLADWDLLEDDDTATHVPITHASLETLGYPTLARIVEAIVADLRPNQATGTASANGSVPAANGGSPPIGSFA